MNKKKFFFFIFESDVILLLSMKPTNIHDETEKKLPSQIYESMKVLL